MQPNQKRISIRWCVHLEMARYFWDRWWMVFDYPPHRNYEVPFYFLKKLYCEFVMNQKPNYFDIKSFQGVGRGMPQHRLGAQSNNPLSDPPIVPLVAPSIPADVQNTSFISTLDALTSLTGNLSEQAAHMASAPRWMPHMCLSCHETCVGPTTAAGSTSVPDEHDAADDSMMTSYMDFLCSDVHLDQIRTTPNIRVNIASTGTQLDTPYGDSGHEGPSTSHREEGLTIVTPSMVDTTIRIGYPYNFDQSQFECTSTSFEELASTTFGVDTAQDTARGDTARGSDEHMVDLDHVPGTREILLEDLMSI
ncbi:uncharacterized protein LOC131031138 [Cryptomeria japonica]|uniref:uncharacterized protein LOC131031138 n=1 Tax=Cryptomeria japonica TaxID=3369 RepID=UPI0027DA0E21|nr:uncharacterized protein LOC131031138 [Cryptomeria japonica]